MAEGATALWIQQHFLSFFNRDIVFPDMLDVTIGVVFKVPDNCRVHAELPHAMLAIVASCDLKVNIPVLLECGQSVPKLRNQHIRECLETVSVCSHANCHCIRIK